MCDRHSKHIINNKVDIWMLGCIVYYLGFRKHPFENAQKLTIINTSYAFPSESTHQYSEKFVDFIRLLLTPNPNYRPDINEVLCLISNWDYMDKIELNVFYFFNFRKK